MFGPNGVWGRVFLAGGAKVIWSRGSIKQSQLAEPKKQNIYIVCE
jgi:hypothetical protein